jgi:hypothetical protein
LILKKGFYIFELSDNKNLIRENIIVKWNIWNIS